MGPVCGIVTGMFADPGPARPPLLLLFLLSALLCGAKADGTLLVYSLTEGATIHVDGRVAGETPMHMPLALAPGEHTLRVSKPGHADYIDTFAVKSGQETLLQIDLIAVAGALSVVARPRGAEVIVDGKLLGEAPWSGDVQPGRRRVVIRAPGHTPWRRTVRIELGQRYPIDVVLLPAEAAETTPWYEEPWVWVGAGAVVTAAVVTGVLLAADDEPVAEPDLVLTIEPVR